ncbi:MAG TPA: IPT/TIG domain-containing protein, partial [Solirubrobacterales bacterium]|nr:IPT/TIG domain-containing protein [Solirubrobacterales bacterium]
GVLVDDFGAGRFTSYFVQSLRNQIAVDDTSGTVYAADYGAGEVEVFSSDVGPQQALTIKKAGDGEGTVTSDPAGIACGPACDEEAANFDEGEVVELTAVEEAGSEFTGWTQLLGDPSTCTGTATPCEVTMGEAKELQAQFDLVATPAVTNLDPDMGPESGGNEVTIEGVNLEDATKVDFGSAEITSFATNTDTEIVLTAPSGTGVVDVIVTTVEGSSPNTADDNYTYVAAPAITDVDPDKGPTAGGNSVTITGTGFTGTTGSPGVKFGANNATGYTVDSDTQITATAPAGSAGTVDVTVTTAGGTSATAGTDDNYTYVAAPAITDVDPDQGPTAGGNSVTITGTNLQDATFDFGANPATAVSVNPGGTSATMNAPAGQTGTVEVTATTTGGTSATAGSANDYEYEVAEQELEASVFGSGGGRIVSSPAGIDCTSGNCTAKFPDGTKVTLTATPDAGSDFVGWSGACSGTGACEITLTEARAVSASFDKAGGPPTILPDPCIVDPASCKATDSQPAYASCVRSANKAFAKARKAARKRTGRARAKAMRRANKQKSSAKANCRRRFR